MMTLKILCLACQLVLIWQVAQYFKFPFPFTRWRAAWSCMLLATICMAGHRFYDLWTAPSLTNIFFKLGSTVGMIACFHLLGGIFKRGLSPALEEPIAHVLVDQYSQILAWDVTATRLLGWTAIEAIGQTLMQTLVPPRDWEAHREEITDYLSRGDIGQRFHRIYAANVRCKNGIEIPVEIESQLFSPDEDKVLFTWQIRALVHL